MNSGPLTEHSTALTMTSREIAELCNSRHNDVVESIERLFQKGVLRGSRNTPRPFQAPAGGRPTMIYDLNKRDTLVIVAGYNATLRARIIDRWLELEAAAAAEAPQFVVPTTLSGALRLAAEQAEAIENQTQLLAAAQPAIAFVDRYVESNTTKGFRQVCKLLSANEHDFREFLLDRKIMYRLSGEWTPYQQHIAAGRFVVKTGTAPANQHTYNRALFTPKGIAWITGEWDRHLAPLEPERA